MQERMFRFSLDVSIAHQQPLQKPSTGARQVLSTFCCPVVSQLMAVLDNDCLLICLPQTQSI